MLAVTPANTCPAAAKRTIVTTTAPKHFSSRVVCIVPPELTSARLTPRFQRIVGCFLLTKQAIGKQSHSTLTRYQVRVYLRWAVLYFSRRTFVPQNFAGHQSRRQSPISATLLAPLFNT